MARLALLLVIALAGRAVADDRADAMAIFERAMAAEKSPKELVKTLEEIDALLVKSPKSSDAHYVRGWILSRAGKGSSEAVAAYDKAFELDGRLADAAYNAGVVLANNGDPRQALVRFERALKVNKRHVDAAYNAGQTYYDIGEFKSAAERWETALKLAPEDFQIAKKLVQAYVALDSAAQVKKARDRVFAMWKKDAAKPKSYLYDQFAAGKYYVYVYETFEPTGDLARVWQAKVAIKDKVIGSVNLETSAVLRDKGVPFILGIDKDGEHQTIGEHTWKKLPAYPTWKALVTKTIESKF